MSRSRKKNCIVKDSGKHKQFAKRQANKKIRKSDCASGGAYKKLYDQYDICDWKCYSDDKKDLRK